MTLSVRESIIATLKDNPGDWFSAREIFDAIEHIDAGTPHRVGNILKIMHQEGLVARQAKGNSNLWCVSPHEPEVPSNGASNLVVKPSMQPPNHHWKEKVCQPRSPRAQPIACELPVHLLTPKPRLEEHCPTSLIQEQEEALEADSAALGLPEIVDATESIEDEAPSVTYPAYPPLSQFYRDQIQAKETDLRNEPTEHHGCNGHCRKAGREPAKPAITTQTRQLPRLPKDYTARIKVGIYADSDNAFSGTYSTCLTIIAEDEGAGAFWTLKTKGGRLSFDQGEADWLPQLGDGLAQLLDTINGRPLTQPEI